MMTKLPLWLGMFGLAVAGMLSGCQPSKIAYGNSYYFRQSPRPKVPPSPSEKNVMIAERPDPSVLYVSTQGRAKEGFTPASAVGKSRQQTRQSVDAGKNEYLKQPARRGDALATAVQEGSLSKRKKRTQRRALRKELRHLVKEYHAVPNATHDMDKGLLLSIILMAGGLLFLIIGATVYASGIGGVIALLGILALVGGLITLIVRAANS